MKTYKIAVIPGDGIGKEVVPEGVRVLEAAARRFGFSLSVETFDWSCERMTKVGHWMPENWKELVGSADVIYFGATGWPALVPDHVSLWGSLIKFRREFDQYVNLRPVRLMPGVRSPLADRKVGEIDYFVVRENTEGEYSSVGGRMFEGTDREFVTQLATFSRKGVDRILRFAFDLARTRIKKHVTSATKSNGISITMPYWDERFRAMAAQYPDIKADQYHIDGLTIPLVLDPGRFDVIVASNLFGDTFPTSGRRPPARSASRLPGTSTPSAPSRPCSSPCTAPPRTSMGGTSRTPSARSGRVPCFSTTWARKPPGQPS